MNRRAAHGRPFTSALPPSAMNAIGAERDYFEFVGD